MDGLQNSLHKVSGRLRRVSFKAWTLIALIGSTLLAGAALIAFAPEPDRRAAAEIVVPVTSLRAETATWAPEVGLYGRVETPHTASLTALVAATVATLQVREGDRVATGDVLLQLHETDARLLVRQRAADLAEVRADLDALKLSGEDDRAVLIHQEELHRLAVDKAQWHERLKAQGSISQQTLNGALSESHNQSIALSRQRNQVAGLAHRLARAEARVDRADAVLEEARVGLDRTRIKAPFPGLVTRIAVAPGELVSRGGVVAEMYDDSRLEVRVQIPNAHLPTLERALAAGERPAVEIDFGDHRAHGQLERLVGAVARGQSGVDGLITLATDAVPPDLGRAVSLRVKLPAIANVVAVPVQAVYGQRRLFVIEDGLLVGIDVERLGEVTGLGGDLKLLVRAAELVDGTPILSSQLSNAVTGLRVEVSGAPRGTDTDGDAAWGPARPARASAHNLR